MDLAVILCLRLQYITAKKFGLICMRSVIIPQSFESFLVYSIVCLNL